MGFPSSGSILNRIFRREPVRFDKRSRECSVYMKVVRFCLCISGLWRGPENRKLNIIWSSVMLVLLTFGLLGTVHQLLLVPQDIDGGTEVLMNVTLIGHSIFTYLVLIRKRATIMRLMTLVESNFNNFSDTIGMKNTFKRNAEKFNVILVVTVCVIIFSVHLSFIGVSKALWIDVPLMNKTLLFPITVPLEMTTTVYYSVFVLELMVTFFEATVHITSITLYTGFINLLCAELRSLGWAFRHLTPIARYQTCSCKSPEEPEACIPRAHLELHANNLLSALVDHHRLLIG